VTQYGHARSFAIDLGQLGDLVEAVDLPEALRSFLFRPGRRTDRFAPAADRLRLCRIGDCVQAGGDSMLGGAAFAVHAARHGSAAGMRVADQSVVR